MLSSSRRTVLLLMASLGCLGALVGCGDTIQDQPVAAKTLEGLVITPEIPVYWVGGSFQGLALGEVAHDPGGAITIHYGDCIEGGQSTCVYPLSLVTSPDNSFRPGGEDSHRQVSLRGVAASAAEQGRTITLATAGVVVDVIASSPALARAAAETMVPINRVGVPGGALPGALPNTGFAAKPLNSQKPPVIHVPRSLKAEGTADR
jgi:hypothetical protein